MKWRVLQFVFLMSCGLMSSTANAQNSTNIFPFVLPWDDSSQGPTDLSGWLHKPAGKFGHVQVGPDGHFYVGNQRVRFFGVNMCFGATVPQKPHAEAAAKRMAKFGINVVRFHHMDTGAWPGGLRDGKKPGTGEPAAEALDRLDYFVSQLKQNGIYANINLLVGRPFKSADRLPAAIDSLSWKKSHIVGFFNSKHIELQKEYARKLLTHRNPYTQMTFAEDPAVAFVEINNENGLVHAWLGNEVDTLPDVFLDDLRQQWNQWLKKKYSSTAELEKAWSQGAEPIGAEMLINGSFQNQLQGWNLEKHEQAQMSASFTDNVPETLRGQKALRLSVQQHGKENWHLQFNQAGLKFVAGQSYTLSFWARCNSTRNINVSASMAHEPWGNLGLSASVSATDQWREFRLVFRATASDERARISFSNLGQAGSTCEFAGFSLKPGGVAGLRADEKLETGTVRRFERKTFGERTAAAQRDWMRFLVATEDNYWQTMHQFLKNDLKVRGLVTGTIVGCAPITLMAKMDWVDTHAYWQHPRFPVRPWDPEEWTVSNKSMVNEKGGTLPRLALKKVLGKPHACTEYNHSAPNTYGSEGALLLAAYAGLQDWDALYIFAYSHSDSGTWDSRKINSFFDIAQHPLKMATLIPAMVLFSRGDVSPARQQMVAAIDSEKEADMLRSAGSWSLIDGGSAGIPQEAALIHRVSVATDGVPVPPGALAPGRLTITGNRFLSDTGELLWDLSEPNRGVVTINTPMSKAVIGYGGGKRFLLGDVAIEPRNSMQDGWCAITMTCMDKPAGRWIITATGYAENSGMVWKNPEKSSVGRKWGNAPSLVEGIAARITLPFPNSRLKVWVLDEKGQRSAPVPTTSAPNNQAFLEIGPQWKTIWYEIQAR